MYVIKITYDAQVLKSWASILLKANITYTPILMLITISACEVTPKPKVLNGVTQYQFSPCNGFVSMKEVLVGRPMIFNMVLPFPGEGYSGVLLRWTIYPFTAFRCVSRGLSHFSLMPGAGTDLEIKCRKFWTICSGCGLDRGRFKLKPTSVHEIISPGLLFCAKLASMRKSLRIIFLESRRSR